MAAAVGDGNGAARSSGSRAVGRTFHFISGLPRSGSTLLSAILRQNPGVHAHITSPVGSLVGAVLNETSASHEGAVFFTQAQREALLRGVFHNYYESIGPARIPIAPPLRMHPAAG